MCNFVPECKSEDNMRIFMRWSSMEKKTFLLLSLILTQYTTDVTARSQIYILSIYK